MKFVEIRTTQGERLALNPEQITHLFRDATSGVIVFALSTDRRVMSNQFRSLAEAVHYCKNTEFSTNKVGELK